MVTGISIRHSGRSSPRAWPAFLPAAAIVVLAVVCYIPAMGGGFNWDDDSLLTDNLQLRSLQGLGRIWMCDWRAQREIPDYYPLTWTSFWVEWRLWGHNPTGYHVVNVLLHAANAVLVWQVLARAGVRWSWLAGLLFAVHPLNVTSVAWIAERKNTLSMLFYLLALLCYLRYDDKAGWRWYAGALGFFAAALLSKTSVVMLPVVLLLIAWWRRDRVTGRDLLAAVPFFALAIALSIIGILYQKNVVIHGAPVRGPHEGFLFRLAVGGIVPWFYMMKAFWPYPLAVIYPRWRIDPADLSWFLPGLALLVGMGLLWRYRKRCKGILTAMLYFLVTLFPVLGFFDMYYHLYSFVADHWQYVSIVGLLALAAGAAETLSRRLPRRAVVVPAAAVVLLLGVLTWRHSSVYANARRTWEDNIAKYPGHFLPYYNLASILDGEGLSDQALAYYRKSIELNAGFDRPYTGIGVYLARRKDYAGAITYFEKAKQIDPGSPTARVNLGLALHLSGRSDQAVQELQEALKISDYNLAAHTTMAKVLADTGKLDQAIAHAQRAVDLEPARPSSRITLAKYLARAGRHDQAIAECRQALSLAPANAEARLILDLQLREIGRRAEAATPTQGADGMSAAQPASAVSH
jgi:tetratricopeptide (TPR) repeat protein